MGDEGDGKKALAEVSGVALQAAAPAPSSSQFPRFDRENYGVWAATMECAMESHGLWDIVDPGGDEFKKGGAQRRRDRQAASAIYSAMPMDLMQHLISKETAKEVWETIKTLQLGHARVREASLQTMMRNYENLQMGDDESVEQFAARVVPLVNGIRTLGEKLDEISVVRRFLRAAAARYLPIVSAIEQCVDLKTLTIDDLVGRYKAHDERMKLTSGDGKQDEVLMLTRSQLQAMVAAEYKNHGAFSSGGKKDDNRPTGNTGGGDKKQKQKSKKKFDKRLVRCHNCNLLGHFKSECRKPVKETALVAAKGGDDGVHLLMMEVCELMEEKPSISHGEAIEHVALVEEKVFLHDRLRPKTATNAWYLDTGASNHMTGDASQFFELNFAVGGTVRFGDGSTVRIEGRGTVLFETRNGEHKALTDVYYIPKLKSNIVSLGQLEERGCKIVLEDGYLWGYDRQRMLLLKVKRQQNRLYILNLDRTDPVCLLSSFEDTAWKWHARYGHLNFQSLRQLGQRSMVQGMPSIEHVEQLCDGCLVGKQRRAPFPRESVNRASKVLELVHGDLCGPITPATPSGNKYFLLVVDDFSRYMWIVLLKSKDQALQAFKLIKTAAEVEAEAKLKAFRTDRGGEFTSKEFTSFCELHGIKRYLTAPYSPQQNGVVERRNQTVVAMARSMMKSKGLPGRFWGEAVTTAVYLLNRAPTKSVVGMTPYEAWCGRKPTVDHLRTFGCVAHVKTVAGHVSKLADRSTPMVMIGYETGSKAYRVYNPATRKVQVTRDVIFEEEKSWAWGGSNEPEVSRSDDMFHVVYDQDAGHDSGYHHHHDDDQEPPATPATPASPPPQNPAVTAVAQGESAAAAAKSAEFAASAATSAGPGHDNSRQRPPTPEKLKPVLELYPTPVRRKIEDAEKKEARGRRCLLGMEEPANFDQAKGEESWQRAMQEEMSSIQENNAWSLVNLPDGQRAIGLKWVFKVKKDSNGAVLKHKARLVAKGYVQQQGIDFEEVFAPVARMESVRLLIALAAYEGWQLHHMDVKSAFLNGDLQEEVYVSQPPGFIEKGEEHKVLKLQKALYGLRQAPRAWYAKLDDTLLSLGFERSPMEHAMYKRGQGKSSLLVGV